MTTTTTGRYGIVTIGLHWLTLLLMVAVYATIELRELFPRGSDPREMLKLWHFTLGLIVLPFVGVRLLARLARPVPPIVPPPPARQEQLAKVAHLGLYLLMVVLPICGWLLLSAEGKPVPFELPALMAPDKALAKSIKGVHEFIATAGYFLIGGHAAAALYHHYVPRDNTLTRMLPGRV